VGVRAERGLRRHDGLVLRVRPGLEPDAPPEAGERCVGDVARREDVRVGSAALLVDDDAVVDCEAYGLRELHVRREPDADDHSVTRHAPPVREDD
jgi:hypothetical protein